MKRVVEARVTDFLVKDVFASRVTLTPARDHILEHDVPDDAPLVPVVELTGGRRYALTWGRYRSHGRTACRLLVAVEGRKGFYPLLLLSPRTVQEEWRSWDTGSAQAVASLCGRINARLGITEDVASLLCDDAFIEDGGSPSTEGGTGRQP
jgi:hypothetical protein